MYSERPPYQKLHVGYLRSYLPHKLEYLYQNNCLEAYLEEVVQATQDRENWLIENKGLDKHAARFISLYQHITPDRTLLAKNCQNYALKQGPFKSSDFSDAIPYTSFHFDIALLQEGIKSQDIDSREMLAVSKRQIRAWYKSFSSTYIPGSRPYQMQIFDDLRVGQEMKVNVLFSPLYYFEHGIVWRFSPSKFLFVKNVPITITHIAFGKLRYRYAKPFRVKPYMGTNKYEKYHVFDSKQEEQVDHHQLAFPQKSTASLKLYPPPEPNWEQLSRAETFLYSDIDLF